MMPDLKPNELDAIVRYMEAELKAHEEAGR